ncbi:hypothetical protein H0H92_002937 [Tricholoma furcatifolium]|nr:hypothetical protein H0H92_002937 [Tricholoma furcatifolium]
MSKGFDAHINKVAAVCIKNAHYHGITTQWFSLIDDLAVCNLPREVLQRIFISCAQMSFQSPAWSWSYISLVCSSWREAALDCPELWTYIDFSHPRWTALSLRRSKNLPIYVRATVNSDNQQDIYRTLHSKPFIRDIHIISSVYDIGPLMGALQNPNCSIESLIVNVTRPHNTNQDLRYSKRSTPPPGPRLTSMMYLELHRTPLNLVSPRFTNLRHLSLHYLPFSERPSRQDFLTLLERFVMLEHLTLVHAFPKNVVTGSSASKRILNLPNLNVVSLTGSSQELASILDCLDLPPTGLIRCHVDRMGDTKANFLRFAKTIGSHFEQSAQEMPLHTLILNGQEESKRFTDANTLNPDFQQSLRLRAFGPTEDVEPLLDLILGPDANTIHDHVIISSLISIWDSLPLMTVHTLSVQKLDIVPQKSWPQLLKPLPMLRVLEIAGYYPSGLLWALLLNARSHSHLEYDDTDSLLLPALEDVYLHKVDCSSGGLMASPSGINSYCDLDDSRFLEVLLAYLEDRQRCSLPIRSLSISHCLNVFVKVLSDVTACVSHLLWDHRGRFKEGLMKLETERPVAYRSHWPSQTPTQRHYFRLQKLMEMD